MSVAVADTSLLDTLIVPVTDVSVADVNVTTTLAPPSEFAAAAETVVVVVDRPVPETVTARSLVRLVPLMVTVYLSGVLTSVTPISNVAPSAGYTNLGETTPPGVQPIDVLPPQI